MRNGLGCVNSNFYGSTNFSEALTHAGCEADFGQVRYRANGEEEAAMSTNNTPNRGGPSIGQRIDEAIELIQMELRHAVAYVNDAVIPQVRRESIRRMRTAAETLRNSGRPV